MSTKTLPCFLLSAVLSAWPHVSEAGDDETDTARLLVLISIDQARFDYLERFRPAFTGGLKYLLDKGVIFEEAHHNHAVTATAAGHASLTTGLYPSHSGIIDNQWFDRASGKEVNAVQDNESPILRPGSSAGSGSSSSGRSPKNLLAPALGDWLKKANPRSKVFTVSRKDRSAILMGGKEADGAFWYDTQTGQLVTSRYYMSEYPVWMKKFHERKIVDSYFGQMWEPIPVDAATRAKLAIEVLDSGVFKNDFPHALGWAAFMPDSNFYTSFYASPFMDTYLSELARVIIDAEALGRDENLDILGLGFSALDAVGHEYGPNSPEVLDVFLRLDQTLKVLLQHLDERVGLGRVVIVLSADHGVMSVPEYLATKGKPGRRFTTEDVACYQGVEARLDAKFGEENWLESELYLDYEALGRRNVRREDVENELARLLGSCPPVQTVWTRTQLESSPPDSDPDRFFEMYKNSFHPDRSPDLYVQVKPIHLERQDRGTSHGTPYEYDTHVPLCIVFPGIPPAVIPERVESVDLAPTLASLLDIPSPEHLDGHDLTPLLRARIATTR